MAKVQADASTKDGTAKPEASTDVQTKTEESGKTGEKAPKSEAEAGPNLSQQGMTTHSRTLFASSRLETEAEMDICLVHCYTGDDDLEAFTPKESANRPQRGPWLEDTAMLQTFAPGARVLVLGFDLRTPTLDAGLEFDSMGTRLLDFLAQSRSIEQRRDRPLVLIGHGLGGTVIQKAIIKTNNDDTYRNQLDRIIGIMFIATPFDGSTLLVEYLEDVLNLTHASAKLDDLDGKFCGQMCCSSKAARIPLQTPKKLRPCTGRCLIRSLAISCAALTLLSQINQHA